MTDEAQSELSGSSVERRGCLDPEVGGVGIGHVNAEGTILAEKNQSGSMLGAGSWVADGDHVLEWERGLRKRSMLISIRHLLIVEIYL